MSDEKEEQLKETAKRTATLYGDRKITLQTRSGEEKEVTVRSLKARKLLNYLDVADIDEEVAELCTSLNAKAVDELTDESLELLSDTARDLNFDRAIRKAMRKVRMADKNSDDTMPVIQNLAAIIQRSVTSAQSSSGSPQAKS